MISSRYSLLLVLMISLVWISSCKENNTPKPRGYFRVDFPEKEYTQSDSTLPYLFEMPVYSYIQKDIKNSENENWVNLQFPKLNATLHLSYKPVDNNLHLYTEDSHEMVYKHSGKADAIIPTEWRNEKNNVYGILYQIEGNAASTIQFYLTDSVNHFVRGSFYFNVHPNKDSLAPAQEFIKADIDRMIETFRWNPAGSP
ncbi:MAG: gliding motility lipoprotein GldD [Bacteroidota bacterium]|nr:gliding motility lipoprotein GldD [Bacteroidota bacterium]